RGKSPDEIAAALIEGAARAAAAAGGAVGMVSALPVLPAFPAEIAAETLVLVGIELKLVAELHEAYASPAPGKFPERMSAYVGAWAHRRGVFMIEGRLIFADGSRLARLLRRRLVARAGRSAHADHARYRRRADRRRAAGRHLAADRRDAPAAGAPPPRDRQRGRATTAAPDGRRSGLPARAHAGRDHRRRARAEDARARRH